MGRFVVISAFQWDACFLGTAFGRCAQGISATRVPIGKMRRKWPKQQTSCVCVIAQAMQVDCCRI